MKNIHVIPTDNYSPLVHSTNKFGGFFKSEHYSPMKEMGDSYQNIYITSDEEIKEGDWMYYKHFGEDIVTKYNTWGGLNTNVNEHKDYYKKIILTTDQDLIKDGVQAIDDEFLEWFVKNPSCEEVEVDKVDIEQPKPLYSNGNHKGERVWIETYKIIIPKEESKQETPESIIQDIATHLSKTVPETLQHIEEFSKELDKLKSKQETLEEAAKRVYGSDASKDVEFYAFIAGAKWQQEKMYSDEEVIELLQKALTHKDNGETGNLITAQGEIRTANFYSWFEQFKKK